MDTTEIIRTIDAEIARLEQAKAPIGRSCRPGKTRATDQLKNRLHGQAS
jgi:hypothetical protein